MSRSPTASIFFGYTIHDDFDTINETIDRMRDEGWSHLNEYANFCLMTCGTYDEPSEYAIAVSETIQDFTWDGFEVLHSEIFNSSNRKYLEWKAILAKVANNYKIKLNSGPKWFAGVLYG